MTSSINEIIYKNPAVIVPNERSSSLPSLTIDKRRNDKRKNIRRYATYDLINNGITDIKDNYIITEESAQDTNSIIPDLIITTSQESPQSFPSIISPLTSPTSPTSSTSPISKTPPTSPNNDYFNEGQSSILEGITVTTVKVVQVSNSRELLTKSYSEGRVSKGPLPKTKVRNIDLNSQKKNDSTQKMTKTTKNISAAQIIKDNRIYNNVNQDDIIQIRMINYEGKLKSLPKRNSSKRRPKHPRTINQRNKKRQVYLKEITITAPTSNPSYTNDPTDMEDDDDITQNPIIKGFPWIPATNVPPKLLHASLIPLDQINKKLSKISSDDVPKLSRSKSIRISDPKPKRPSQLFRENLLEQSVAMSLNEAVMGRNVLVPLNQIDEVEKVIPSDNHPRPPRSSRSKKSKRISTPKPKRPSQLFRENLLEQSVSMSLNEVVMGRNVFIPLGQKEEEFPSDDASRSKSKSGMRTASENLSEQSVAMNSNNIGVSKLPRRRYSKKGSNAKLEDRVTRRERRRKEKEEQNTQIKLQRILETDELREKVEEQLRKNAILHLPPPPPRSPTRPIIEPRKELVVRRRRSKITLSPIPDRRLTPNRGSNIPFPAHLARRNTSLHKSKSKIHAPFTTHITSSAIF